MSNNSYEVIFYETPSNHVPVDDFLDSLQIKVRAKIVFGSNQYRILYFFFGKIIVLTHGFPKKTDKVPPLEIKRAENYMNDFLNRYQGAN